ncbi:thiol:disulfide oxidoreductase [Novosphingobium indicum]|uniref:Thiol:disulfide oxidoreductase n=1 Tax=Novosphingobium indicum TaxID=462949 RepID=A0ABQ2JQJ9_9SPHN|nr:glutathione S-transferase N-terminal domain-containing protein [Novosphingobium indicum]GGN52531.1 thiol:disulfide oxidoreductase [Novosphingobium indicum]
MTDDATGQKAGMEPITLLGVASPNVVKVAIMLEELALPYRLQHVELFKGEQFTPEFLALNPAGKVPVLLDPALGKPLAESGAILIWLAEHYGAFLPASGPERYDVLQWLMVQMSAIGPMLGQFTHFSLLPSDSEPYAHGRYAALADRLYHLVDDRLAEREWIAGNAYSIADIATLPWAEYCERHGYSWDAFPAMARWRETLSARPAVERAKARVFDTFIPAAADTLRTADDSDLDRFFGRTETMPRQDFNAVRGTEPASNDDPA